MALRPTAAELIRSSRRLLVAHRGDSRAAPENTLPAFLSAARVGVDFVELDYLHSVDGVPVVFHDETLDRTTNASQVWGTEKIPFASKTLHELRQLDAGSWFGPKFTGTPISTLGEVLAAIAPTACVMIERKAGDAATCWRTIQDAGTVDRVTVHAFDWSFLADLRRLAPNLPLGALGSKQLTDDAIHRARNLGATIVNWEAASLDADRIAAIHRAGLKSWTWTVDDPAEARRLLTAGLNALTTNVPALMQPLFAAHP